MTEQISSLDLATIEQYFMGVLADVERGKKDRNASLPLIMEPMKRLLQGGHETVIEELRAKNANWAGK